MLDAWADRRSGPLYEKWAASRKALYLKARGDGFYGDVPVAARDFRLLICVRYPGKAGGGVRRFFSGRGQEEPGHDLASLVTQAAEGKEAMSGALGTAYLQPESVHPDRLIRFLYEVFNPAHPMQQEDVPPCDHEVEIREQAIYADTDIKVEDDHLFIDDRVLRTLSVKHYPNSVFIGKLGGLLGSLFDNQRQLPCPFLLTLNVLKLGERELQAVQSKAAATLNQQGMISLIPRLGLKKEDYQYVLQALEEGKDLVKANLSLALLAPSKDAARKAASQAVSLWKTQGFTLQDDCFIVLPLFLSMLPLGHCPEVDRLLKRGKTMLTSSAAHLAPVQADWKGTGTPTLALASRRGQVMFADLFDSDGNYNAVVTAASGSGKSFLVNSIITSYLGIGGRVWVIDVGRSYQKLAGYLGGEFIVFSRDNPLCLNPFSRIRTAAELEEESDILLSLLCQMASPSREVGDLERSYLEKALRGAFADKGSATTISDVSRVLRDNFDDPRAHDLATMLYPFTGEGRYGRFFEGQANLSFSGNFVVLELEELKGKRELQEVVLLLIIYHISRDMYFGRRDLPKLMIIDEAWDLMSGGNTARFIEHGYRRFRKYGGAAVTVTQSLADFYREDVGEVGKAILENSDFMFLLRQKPESLEMLRKENKLVLNPLAFEQLKSVHTSQGRYSEIFLKTPRGWGIGRLIVNRFSYYLYTTRPDEVEAIRRLTEQGKTLEEAIACLG
ncbi:MAG: type IV secretion system protein TraC [Pseudomonadota bacterium]